MATVYVTGFPGDELVGSRLNVTSMDAVWTGVGVSVGTDVSVGMLVGISVGTEVSVGVGVEVLVGVMVGVSVGVGVAVGVSVGVSVGTGVSVGVDVGVSVGDGVGVAVGGMISSDVLAETVPVIPEKTLKPRKTSPLTTSAGVTAFEIVQIASSVPSGALSFGVSVRGRNWNSKHVKLSGPLPSKNDPATTVTGKPPAFRIVTV